MVENFNLIWRMTIDFPDGRANAKTIGYPLTCSFDIKKFASAINTYAEFKIYNLSQATRQILFQDIWDGTYTGSQPPNVTFECGYGDKLVKIWESELYTCNSVKDSGSTDIITTLVCYNTSAFSPMSVTYQKGTPKREVIINLIQDAGFKTGTISDIEGTLDREYPIVTSMDTAVRELSGNCISYDGNKVNVVMPAECVEAPVFEFNSSNIYGTPKRDSNRVDFSTKLFPEIVYDQLVKLSSSVQPEYNGEMKVFGLQHVGTISGGVPCSAQTNISCVYETPRRMNVPQNITSGAVRDSKTGAENNNTKAYKTFTIVDKNGKPINRSVTETLSLKAVWMDIKQNGKDAKSLNKKAYKNVKWGDLIQPNNFKYSGLPDYEHITNAYTMLKSVYSNLEKVIGNRVIKVLSCWRNQGNNTACGGVPDSRHLQGLAIDFELSTPTLTRNYANSIINMWKPYGWAGYYPNLHFIHVQLNSNKIDSK